MQGASSVLERRGEGPLRTMRRYQSLAELLAGCPGCVKRAGLSFHARHEIC